MSYVRLGHRGSFGRNILVSSLRSILARGLQLAVGVRVYIHRLVRTPIRNLPNDRGDCLCRRERERTGPACLRKARTEERTVSSAERARQGQAGCPEHGRCEIFSFVQRAVEYNVRGWLHRREQNQEQRKVAKLTQLVEARVHRRDSTRE